MRLFGKRKRLALALGSGGARGLAHIGVIEGLSRNGLEIRAVAGSSAGALIGAMYCARGEIDWVREIALGIGWTEMASILADPFWGGQGLIKGGKVMKFLREYLGEMKIEDFKIPFAAMATDLLTGEEVVLDRGDAVEAIRASISIPLVFAPYHLKGRVLVDGGVSAPVPVEEARKLGGEVVLAVNLDGVYFEDKKLPKKESEVIKNSIFGLRYNLAKKQAEKAEIVLIPKMRYRHDFDFVGGDEVVKAGRKAVEGVLEVIREKIW